MHLWHHQTPQSIVFFVGWIIIIKAAPPKWCRLIKNCDKVTSDKALEVKNRCLMVTSLFDVLRLFVGCIFLSNTKLFFNSVWPTCYCIKIEIPTRQLPLALVILCFCHAFAFAVLSIRITNVSSEFVCSKCKHLELISTSSSTLISAV